MKNIVNKSFISVVSMLLVALVSFSGCGKNAFEAAGYTDPEFEGAKPWVMMPYVEGYVAALGIAKANAGNDFSFQRQEAMADARDNLAKQLATKVNAMFKSYKASTDGTFDKSSEAVSKQIASQTLRGSRIKDTWISKSKTLYVLMIIDTKSVAKLMEKTIKSSYKNDKAMYQKFLASKAQGELDKELSKADNQ